MTHLNKYQQEYVVDTCIREMRDAGISLEALEMSLREDAEIARAEDTIGGLRAADDYEYRADRVLRIRTGLAATLKQVESAVDHWSAPVGEDVTDAELFAELDSIANIDATAHAVTRACARGWDEV